MLTLCTSILVICAFIPTTTDSWTFASEEGFSAGAAADVSPVFSAEVCTAGDSAAPLPEPHPIRENAIAAEHVNANNLNFISTPPFFTLAFSYFVY